MRSLFVLLYVTSCLVVPADSYNFPTIEEMTGMFGDLMKKLTDVAKPTENADEVVDLEAAELHERSRRQTSNIGDESQLPYEIRSSR